MGHVNSVDKHTTVRIGQAGVYRVASKLLMMGIRVWFPSVDVGADLMTEDGVRIQVKSTRWVTRRTCYENGAYWFHFNKTKVVNRHVETSGRAMSAESDVVVLWGIDHDRFWIVPSPELDGCRLIVLGFEATPSNHHNDEIVSLHKAGMDNADIASQLGVSVTTVQRKIKGENCDLIPRGRRVSAYENQWDIVTCMGNLVKTPPDPLARAVKM